MKTALGSAALREPAAGDSLTEATDGGQLVLVRPSVLDNVGHVLGNLFQRMYHLAERAKESDTVVAAELESSTARLEDFLKLVMDYMSPPRLSLQSVPAGDVAQSLARQIGDVVGMAPSIDGLDEAGLPLLVDPGCLSRSFALIAGQLRAAGRTPAPAMSAVASRTEQQLRLLVRMPPLRLQNRSTEAEMQWVVAERLIESQGGALRESLEPDGEVSWEVTLPLQA